MVLNVLSDLSVDQDQWIFEDYCPIQDLAKDIVLMSNYSKLLETSTNESYKNIIAGKLKSRINVYSQSSNY
jgi:hypothetical protein